MAATWTPARGATAATKKRPPRCNGNGLKGCYLIPILPDGRLDVKKGGERMANELFDLRTSKGIPAKDMVNVVRAIYPRFDKPLLSKCQHPELYGVELLNDAMDALRREYHVTAVAMPTEGAPAIATSKPKRDHHRRSRRIYCRLEDEDYLMLRECIREDGYKTVQAWMEHVIRYYIKRRTGGAGNA